jgi:hypothetical protein
MLFAKTASGFLVFREHEGHEIRVVTNLHHVSAEMIADMYQTCWFIEVFFSCIKQYLNVPTLFGTTQNDSHFFGQCWGYKAESILR